jgi:hypothetical protein
MEIRQRTDIDEVYLRVRAELFSARNELRSVLCGEAAAFLQIAVRTSDDREPNGFVCKDMLRSDRSGSQNSYSHSIGSLRQTATFKSVSTMVTA